MSGDVWGLFSYDEFCRFAILTCDSFYFFVTSDTE